jgi:co-chaperonin GroES (HSP10)|tara:strand:- start:86 stop:403 length:318 start_codon:yes stop_codon:yes gene_type:complete
MKFDEVVTKSGIIILSDDGTTGGIHPRWAEVIAVGNEQEDIQVGQWVLVAHGRWSRGFTLNDVESRTVDPNDILGISDTSPHEEIYKPTMGHQTHGKTEDHSGYS